MIPLREPQYYDAFVYQYTNVINDKIYLGYHVGSIHDGYDGSCEDPQFSADMANGNLMRKIIEYGTHLDMIELEREMLLEVDARNNAMYYNRTNGGGAMLKNFVRPSLDDLEDKINNITPIVVDIDKLLKLKRYQARHDAISTEHVKDLTDDINDDNGDNSDLVVTVLQGRDNDKDQVYDGNHSLDATKESKHATTIAVKYVPKDIWSKYTDHELHTLAMRKNPVPKKKRLASNKADGIKWILSKYAKYSSIEAGELIGSSNDYKELKKIGYSTRIANSIVRGAKDQLVNNASFAALVDGEVWNMWADKKMNDKREEFVDRYRNKDTLVICKSSGGFRLDSMLLESIKPAHFKKDYVVVCIYHNSPAAEKKWYREYQPQWEKVVKRRLPKMNVVFKSLDTISRAEK